MCVKNVYCGGKKQRKVKIQKQSEDNIIKSIRTLLEQQKKMKQLKTNSFKSLFKQQEEDLYKLVRVGNFYSNIISNVNVMVI